MAIVKMSVKVTEGIITVEQCMTMLHLTQWNERLA